MGSIELADLAVGPEAERLASRAMCVMPVSACEQHGPHLPAGTDAAILDGLKDRVVARLAEDVDLVWLPHLRYGSSEEHVGLPGTVSLRPETFLAVVDDVCRSLAAGGVRSVVLFNGHGGNAPLLQVAARQARLRHDLRVSVVRPLAGLPGTADGELDMHAGCWETSVMLHLAPHAVREDLVPDADAMAAARTGLATRLGAGGGPQVGWRTTDLSSNGVIGLPHLASAEQGEQLVASIVDRIVGELEAATSMNGTDSDEE